MTSRMSRLRSRHFSLAAPGQPPYRILFFGTDDVSLATLQMLQSNRETRNSNRLVEDIEVVCPSDREGKGRKAGESVPVKKFANRCGLKVFETPAYLKSLKNWDFPVTDNFDVGVVVSFGYLLHSHMLNNLYHGAINMHPSLLPKYRGPAPIHHALLNGDLTTGVSVIEIDPKAFDVGRILLQEPYDIKPNIQCQELTRELASFGAKAVLKTLADLPARKKVAVVQDDGAASKAPKVTFQDSLITFEESATEIFHRWQALCNSVGINVEFRQKVVKLIEIRLPSEDELRFMKADEARNGSASTRTFIYEKQRGVLWLRCAKGTWVLVIKLQQAGRSIISATDFCNGYRLKNMQREQFENLTTFPLNSKL